MNYWILRLDTPYHSKLYLFARVRMERNHKGKWNYYTELRFKTRLAAEQASVKHQMAGLKASIRPYALDTG